jgi:spore germination protein KB
MKTQPETISLWQMLTLIVTFEAGSAIVIGIGNQAKQSAWLAILIATAIGLLTVWLYVVLCTRRKSRNLFEIMEQLLGRWGSVALILVYVLYFSYLASRILRDFGELIVSAILVNTPLEVISFTMMLLIMYILYLGVEVLARTGEIFAPYLFGFLMMISIMLIASGTIEWKRFLPVLPDGLGPILRAVFPGLVGFPFGEMIVFTTVFPNVSNRRLVGRVSLYGIAFSGVALSFSSLLEVAALGADNRARSPFPLLSAARNVSLGNFIERIDALVVFIVMLGIVIKVSLFMYAALKGLEQVFQMPHRSFLVPLGMLISVCSILVSKNFTEHLTEGLNFVPLYLHLPMQFGIPLLLLLLLLLRKGRENGPPEGGSSE